MSTNLVAWALALAALTASPPNQDPQAPEEPRVGIRFEGFLPGTHDEKLQGEFTLDFRIYLSPQGGDAVWSETQKVSVSAGRMDVVLGRTTPVPMSIHEATFKFLGASVGGAREVYPRFAIVNTVYVSPEEALTPPKEARATPARGAGALYSAPGAQVSPDAQAPATWKQALISARKAGGDLPDYQDWYGALAHCTKEQALERAGHYEWVLPWVYDTASHGDYNRLFRGRFQGCEYMDLSPSKSYVYRIARPLERDLPAGAQGNK